MPSVRSASSPGPPSALAPAPSLRWPTPPGPSGRQAESTTRSEEGAGGGPGPSLLADIPLACGCIRGAVVERFTHLDEVTVLLRCRPPGERGEPGGLRWCVVVADGAPLRARVFASEYEARETHLLYGPALGPAHTARLPFACDAVPPFICGSGCRAPERGHEAGARAIASP